MLMLLYLNKVCVIASPKGVAISRFYPGDCFASLAMTDHPESNAETYSCLSEKQISMIILFLLTYAWHRRLVKTVVVSKNSIK